MAASNVCLRAAALPPPPSVTITSRAVKSNIVHLKGALEGTALKSAGIYEDDHCVKAFKLAPTIGKERVELDLAIGDPPPDMVIRVTDSDGRSAEAPVLETRNASAAASAPTLPAEAAAPFSNSDNAVAEIPTHGPPRPSPSKRHTIGARLAEVHIEVLSISETNSTPPTYEISGQIQGAGITHAGIYVDGRLATQIPVKLGVTSINFDQSFVMNGDSASIRAYGLGSQFVENSLDLSDQTASEENPAPLAPMMIAPPSSTPGIGVEITSLQVLGAKLYAVSGVISGHDLASAGLYQNGALAQEIAVGGNGITINSSGLGDLLGGIIPSRAKSINFNVRYNPAIGPASIRAYAKNGAYTEQPIFMRGMRP